MPEKLALALGERIRSARARRSLTQDALAAAIGRSPESISNIERGKSEPTIDTLMAIAKALDISITTLVGEVRRGGFMSANRSLLERDLTALTDDLSEADLTIVIKLLTVFVGAKGR